MLALAMYVIFKVDKKQILRALRWARMHEREGMALFVLAYVAALVLMLPGSIFALIGGAPAAYTTCTLAHALLQACCVVASSISDMHVADKQP